MEPKLHGSATTPFAVSAGCREATARLEQRSAVGLLKKAVPASLPSESST